MGRLAALGAVGVRGEDLGERAALCMVTLVASQGAAPGLPE